MSKRELQYALLCACLLMAVTCLPYFLVWWTTPRDGVFPGLLWNSDDHGAYFAWMRQAADGRMLFRNLFTTEPQRGVYFHLYFLLLGWLSRLPGLDIPLAYHLGRFLFGVVTLVLVYRLGALVTEDLFKRRCIFWVTALSGGLGWLFWADQAVYTEPPDVWQPEALTFPSLYANGLFAVSLALMLGVVICLLLAESRGRRWALFAGLCGLVLGNIHSYDVIHLTVVWVAYLLGRWLLSGRFPVREFGFALIAAAVAAPSVAYMAWFYLAEPYFRARADTATLSPEPFRYLLGYGLLIPLAVWGGVVEGRGEKEEGRGRPPWVGWLVGVLVIVAAAWGATRMHRAGGELQRLVPLVPLIAWVGWLVARRPGGRDKGPAAEAALRRHALLAVLGWAMVGIAAAYLPFAFQRKMIMGYHLPLGILAGLAVADLGQRLAGKTKQPWTAPAAAALAVALLSITSIRYLIRDVSVAYAKGTTSTGIHPVYLRQDQLEAYRWLHGNTPPDARLLAWPISAVLAPAYSGRTVFAGHWAETPDFRQRLKEAAAFYRGSWSSLERRRFLQDQGITHIQVGPEERSLIAEGQARHGETPLDREPFLEPVFHAGETTIYRVR